MVSVLIVLTAYCVCVCSRECACVLVLLCEPEFVLDAAMKERFFDAACHFSHRLTFIRGDDSGHESGYKQFYSGLVFCGGRENEWRSSQV